MIIQREHEGILTDVLPRLHFVFASEAPVCVILRRGPSKWVHLLKWNTHDDTVEAGAWFHGRIYGEGCDLSPDGKHFVFFAAQRGRDRDEGYTDMWTAVSKPPWLTALAIWPRTDTWGCGAYFADNSTLVIDCPFFESPIAHENHPPIGLKVIPRWVGRHSIDQELPKIPMKAAEFESSRGRDQFGKPFCVQDGQLLRETHSEARPVADFRDMQPDPKPSPDWARAW